MIFRARKFECALPRPRLVMGVVMSRRIRFRGEVFVHICGGGERQGEELVAAGVGIIDGAGNPRGPTRSGWAEEEDCGGYGGCTLGGKAESGQFPLIP